MKKNIEEMSNEELTQEIKALANKAIRGVKLSMACSIVAIVLSIISIIT